MTTLLSNRSQQGFTLLEISVVLTLMGMMAALALPAFTKYIRKGQTSEVRVNIQTVAALERSHYLDHKTYLACPPTPKQVPKGKPAVWPRDSCWDQLGFRPEGSLYQYETLHEDGVFYVRARGDLDGDGEHSLFEMQLDAGIGYLDRKNELE